MTTTHGWAKAALLGALTILTAACHDSVSGFESTGGGYYVLQTVDGADLPFVASQSGRDLLRLDDGQIGLFANGTYEDDLIYDVVTDGALKQRIDVIQGSWTVDAGGVVTFTETTPTKGATYTGAAVGTQLTLTVSKDGWPDGQHVLVYGR